MSILLSSDSSFLFCFRIAVNLLQTSRTVVSCNGNIYQKNLTCTLLMTSLSLYHSPQSHRTFWHRLHGRVLFHDPVNRLHSTFVVLWFDLDLARFSSYSLPLLLSSFWVLKSFCPFMFRCLSLDPIDLYVWWSRTKACLYDEQVGGTDHIVKNPRSKKCYMKMRR